MIIGVGYLVKPHFFSLIEHGISVYGEHLYLFSLLIDAGNYDGVASDVGIIGHVSGVYAQDRYIPVIFQILIHLCIYADEIWVQLHSSHIVKGILDDHHACSKDSAYSQHEYQHNDDGYPESSAALLFSSLFLFAGLLVYRIESRLFLHVLIRLIDTPLSGNLILLAAPSHLRCSVRSIIYGGSASVGILAA